MEKFIKFFAGLLAAFVFSSCSQGLKTDTLEVMPSSSIEFKSVGNEDVTLNITTDAGSWSYDVPDWIVATKEEKALIVRASDNTSSESRADRITISAGKAVPVSINVWQSEFSEGDIFFNVTPAEPIEFVAASAAPVELSVETNASEWDVEAPEWITASKEANKVTLTANDNFEQTSRVGRVDFMVDGNKRAGIPVRQAGAALNPDAVNASLSDAQGEDYNIEIASLNVIERSLRVSLDDVLEENAELQIELDPKYLSEYNYINGTDCELYPESLVSFASEGKVIVNAGETGADAGVSINPDSYDLRNNASYLVPLVLRTKNASVNAPAKTCRVNYVISRKCKKEVQNVLYFEVNDVNPLNALEYRLEDGSMFFDAVVLFAANINYNGIEDKVYLHNNDNVQALLDETDVYLQPLRKAGIKVILGILGNHDPAGICQLSDWGCQQYALELANAVKEYKLDGVTFDDEYSASPIPNNKWFTSPSPSAGAKLLYETKKALTENVPWETLVSAYAYGGLTTIPNAYGHKPGEFIDFWVADYGFASRQLPGMTMKQCCAMSVELSRDRGNVSAAYGAREKGYGWFMWFSFNPVKKLEGGVSAFREAADGLYGMKLIEPTGIYYKIGEGEYDPERHEL